MLLFLSALLPKRFLPLTYLLGAALTIQLSASAYFFFSPHHFTYDLDHYILGMMTLGLYFLFLIPPMLALIYYIFEFPFWRKCFTTLFILGYFIVALPFQYMLHALIISAKSYLFMPLLYLLFGFLLDMLMFIGLYSWAMSRKLDEAESYRR